MKLPKIWKIVIAAVLGIALLLGAALGTVSAVKRAGAVMAYRGITVSDGVYAYLSLAAKTAFLSENGVSYYRAESFFRTAAEDGETYADKCRAAVEQYVREIVVASYLYDRYASLTSADRKSIQNTVNEIIEQHGGKDAFRAEAEPYGFDEKDFARAAQMIYRASRLLTVLYGDDGSGVAAESEFCQSVLENTFVRVRLLFLRLDTRFVTDEYGNRVSAGGNDAVEDLSDTEKTRRRALAEQIEKDTVGTADAALARANFDRYITQYGEGDAACNDSGYYFARYGNAYTAEFGEAFPAIVQKARALAVGEMARVDGSFEVGGGYVCFLFREEPIDGAYADASLAAMFSDFYTYTSALFHQQTVGELTPLVEVTDRFADLDVLSFPLPADNSFLIKGFAS